MHCMTDFSKLVRYFDPSPMHLHNALYSSAHPHVNTASAAVCSLRRRTSRDQSSIAIPAHGCQNSGSHSPARLTASSTVTDGFAQSSGPVD
jgi:hypothetical protein